MWKIEIRDQLFSVKQNLVTNKVVCCDPEKIRDKICCKSEGSIKTIEIVEPQKPQRDKNKPEADGKEKDSGPPNAENPGKGRKRQPTCYHARKSSRWF